jgi:hypothetical protein
MLEKSPMSNKILEKFWGAQPPDPRKEEENRSEGGVNGERK